MIADPRRPWTSRIAVRFALVLALALLPIGLVSVLQTNALEDEIHARANTALLGATLRAAEGETDVIRRTQGMIAGVAAILPRVIDDRAACIDLMKNILALEPSAAVVAFVPLDGQTTCASTGKEYDFSAEPKSRLAHAERASFMFVNPAGPISGISILGISEPVFASDGSYLGFVGLSLPHRALRELNVDQDGSDSVGKAPSAFWTFDIDGTLLTSSVEMEVAQAQLPAGRPLTAFANTTGEVFSGRTQDGTNRTYAVVPIVTGNLYLMSSWVPETTTKLAALRLNTYLPTVLMWLAGLIVSAFAAERLVTRHVRKLNAAIVRFAQGDRRLQPIDANGAPVELGELADAFATMTDSITRSEADLEDSVHQKEVLLREVHHRVKNNLQLISSIMNIQIRNAKGGEARELVKNLQERIMSLATVHRGLYQTSGLADVKARELIPDIVRQIMALSSGAEKPFETELDIDDLRLVPDQAVPLSLLLAEAMTNALKHAGASRSHPGKLQVKLKRAGGSNAVLEVSNSRRKADAHIDEQANINTGLGTQLITAFVQQLGGRQDSAATEHSFSLSVTFGLSPLSFAENRQISHLNLAEAGNGA